MSKLCFFFFFPCLNYSYNSSEAIKLENAHIIFVSPMIVLQLDLGLHVTVWIGVCAFSRLMLLFGSDVIGISLHVKNSAMNLRLVTIN